MSKKDTILVLGCGPAGLLCAHAAKLSGLKVQIISKKEPSFISGAQFLHTAIPELTDRYPDGQIFMAKEGSAKVYAEKIYGDKEARTSWDAYPPGFRDVWHLQRWYEVLWKIWEGSIIDGVFSAPLMRTASKEFLAVFSTIPLTILFPTGRFTAEHVIVDPAQVAQPNTIFYNGYSEDVWYRASNVFGHAFVEYPTRIPRWLPEGTVLNTSPAAKKIRKPLAAKVENDWENLFLFGRYGKWEKGVLVDDAFREAKVVAEAIQ